MGPIPPDFTLERIVGLQLTQICIGPFDLQFRFGTVDSVACQGTVIVELNDKTTTIFRGVAPFWLDVTPLPQIVGRDATAWKIEATHEFSITLSSGAKLRFLSTDCPYEEFVIQPESQVI